MKSGDHVVTTVHGPPMTPCPPWTLHAAPNDSERRTICKNIISFLDKSPFVAFLNYEVGLLNEDIDYPIKPVSINSTFLVILNKFYDTEYGIW